MHRGESSPSDQGGGIGEQEFESGDESIDEEGRKPTQQQMDEDGVEDKPVDAEWDTPDGEEE